jgi:hypothetical protein
MKKGGNQVKSPVPVMRGGAFFCCFYEGVLLDD